MSEPLRFWSYSVLKDQGLGTSDPLVNWVARTTAAAALDNAATVRAMLNDKGRDEVINWLARQRYASSGKAKLRGSDVHKAAEALALGRPAVTQDPVNQPYVERLTEWLTQYRPRFVMAEAPVYNTQYRYAGTCDGIIDLQGGRFIYDIKTTDKDPEGEASRPPYPEVALQLCAYSRCDQVGVLKEQRYSSGKRYYLYDPDVPHEVMPKVDGALCIVVSPYDCFAVPVRIDDDVWRAWLHVIACAKWRLAGAHDLFGTPLAVTTTSAAV